MRTILRLILAVTYGFLIAVAIYLPFSADGVIYISLLVAGIAAAGIASLLVEALSADPRPWVAMGATLGGTTILLCLTLGCSVLFALVMREPAAYAAYSFVVFLVFAVYQLAVYHPDFEGLPHLPLTLAISCMLFGAPMVFVAVNALFLVPLAALLVLWMLFVAGVLVVLSRSPDDYLASMLLFCATAALMVGATAALFVVGPILFPPLLVVISAGLGERYLATRTRAAQVATSAEQQEDDLMRPSGRPILG